jgi:hypothetical protein
MKTSPAVYKKYLSQVQNAIPDTSASKKEILLQMKYDVKDYVAEHPNYSYDDLVAEFGSPESITDSILSFQSAQLLRKDLLHKRIAIFLAVLVLILLTCFLTSKYIEHQNTLPASGYIELKIINSDND